MKFRGQPELLDMGKQEMGNDMVNPFRGGYSVDYSDLRIRARIDNLSFFDYIMFKLGLRTLKKSDLNPGDLYY
jgi:hypothetical protein